MARRTLAKPADSPSPRGASGDDVESLVARIRGLRAGLITGSQRSGTTWVGNVLAHSPRVRYVHEPFNHLFHEDGQRVACPTSEHFHRVGEGDEAVWLRYLAHRLGLDGALRGPSSQAPRRSAVARVVDRIAGGGRPTPLLKDPIALFSAEWLLERLGMRAVIMVRHPAAYVSSILRLDWRINVVRLAEDPVLLSGDLASLATELRARIGVPSLELLEEACLVWRACTLFTHRLRARRPDVLVTRNEDASNEPPAAFERMCTHLDIPFDGDVRAALTRHTRAENPAGAEGKVHQLRRNSRANVWRWKERLDSDAVERVKRLTADVWPLFYDDGDW